MKAETASNPISFLTGHAPLLDARLLGKTLMKENHTEIEDIYRRYGPMVERRCLAILHNEEDAEDAAQEVFIRVMKSIGGFKRESSPATWLYRIATNICLNRIRDSKNRERLIRLNYSAPDPEQPIEFWPKDLSIRLLAGFDDVTREIVMYSVVEEMTHREIASMINCSVSKVRKRLISFNERVKKKAARLFKEEK